MGYIRATSVLVSSSRRPSGLLSIYGTDIAHQSYEGISGMTDLLIQFPGTQAQRNEAADRRLDAQLSAWLRLVPPSALLKPAKGGNENDGGQGGIPLT